jgi:hypothetical protein
MTDPTPMQPTEPIDSTHRREEARKKVDAWIASQPEPRPKRYEAIERLLAEALAFALRYSGKNQVRDSGDIMARMVAKRLVEHLERSGFVIMKKPPSAGGATIGRGFDLPQQKRAG